MAIIKVVVTAGRQSGAAREGQKDLFQEQIVKGLEGFFTESQADVLLTDFFLCSVKLKVLFEVKGEKFRAFMSLGGSQINEVYAIKALQTLDKTTIAAHLCDKEIDGLRASVS